MGLYMKWGDGKRVKGTVTDKNHEDWIHLESVSLSTSRPAAIAVGSGKEKRHRDMANISDLTVSRSYDQASPLLFTESVSGGFSDVLIVMTRTAQKQGQSGLKIWQVALRKCLITSYSLGGGEAGASETFTLNFSAIALLWKTYDAKDAFQGNAFGQFDLTTAKATAWKALQ